MPEQRAGTSTECSEVDQRKYAMRLVMARTRLLWHHGFYGLLLMHVKLSLDLHCATAYTDAERIAFSPAFLDTLTDEEVDFVLMHEVLHIALAHCFRSEGYHQRLFNIAADIVVNSTILAAGGSITLKQYGESMHLAPNGKEGNLYSAEEVYHMLLDKAEKSQKQSRKGKGKGSDSSDSASQGDQSDGEEGEDASQGKDAENGKEDGKKKGTDGSGDGSEDGKDQANGGKSARGDENEGFDDHSHWGQEGEKDAYMQDAWRSHVLSAVEAVSKMAGDVPLGISRAIAEWQDPQTDWRTVLNDFVHEEVCDYSFSPPDRRFSDSPFFLPDFNDTETVIEDVLFFVDTSGSISTSMLTAAFSEIKGAIDQFEGKLRGHLGFFDAEVYPPIPFESVDELGKIRPKGGGGTSFEGIFDYVQKEMQELSLACIVILTDGYATFPKESEAMGIPVLWLINNDEVEVPWGKVTRIKEDKKKKR